MRFLSAGILAATLFVSGCTTMSIHDDPSPTAPLASETGAALTWTSEKPHLVRARELILAGELAEAEKLVGSEDEADVQTREIIGRLRYEYSLDTAAMLEKLAKDIPDITAQELQEWTDARAIQWRKIDGQVRYFRREPGNMFRFDGMAKERRKPFLKPVEPNTFVLTEHLAAVVKEADATGQTLVQPVVHHVTYTLTVKPNRPGEGRGVAAGQVVRAWLPLAKEMERQTNLKIVSMSPEDGIVAPNGHPQRTVYFEQAWKDPTQPLVFRLDYQVTVHARYARINEAVVHTGNVLEEDPALAVYLAERPPHIVFTPQIRELVDKLTADKPTPLAKAAAIYHWIDDNIPWHGEMEYCLIPSLPTAALERLRGDCGVVGMTFITMCRAAGVPARWQSGFQTKPGELNMHDWAEFYIAPYGWLPADVSFGKQKPRAGGPLDERIRNFYFGHIDAYRLVVNSDYGRTLFPPKKHLRSEPLDFQRGEVEIAGGDHGGRNLYFDEWSWDIDVKYEQTKGGGK